MKNQGNITPPKEQNKAPVMDRKAVEIYGLYNKQFQTVLLKNLGKPQENMDN